MTDTSNDSTSPPQQPTADEIAGVPRWNSMTEAWLRKEVATAFDRLKSDPSRALTLDDVRAALAVEHARAVGAATVSVRKNPFLDGTPQ